jgi:hypothetical protein
MSHSNDALEKLPQEKLDKEKPEKTEVNAASAPAALAAPRPHYIPHPIRRVRKFLRK